MRRQGTCLHLDGPNDLASELGSLFLARYCAGDVARERGDRAHVRIEEQEFIDAGGRVAVIGRLIGKGKGSGVEVERRINGQVWTVRNGRIVRLEFGFTDREATLEAAGLSE